MKTNELLKKVKKLTESKLTQDDLKPFGLDIKNCEFADDGTVTYNGFLSFEDQKFTKIPFKFHTVKGNFILRGCSNLTTLENCPDEVHGQFNATGCSSLKSLDFLPAVITKMAIFENCPTLENVDALAKSVITGTIDLSHCEKLKTINADLINVGKHCKGSFLLGNTGITSLKNCPKFVNIMFSVDDCSELQSLEGCPNRVDDHISIENAGIGPDLTGIAKTVGSLFIKHCKNLKSLEGISETVAEDLHISDCPELTTLEMPHVLGGDLRISNCPKIVNYLTLLDVRGLKKVSLSVTGELSSNIRKVETIINKWLPTQDIAKAQQELEKAGLGEYAEY